MTAIIPTVTGFFQNLEVLGILDFQELMKSVGIFSILSYFLLILLVNLGITDAKRSIFEKVCLEQRYSEIRGKF